MVCFNALAATALLRLGTLLGRGDYLDAATQTLAAAVPLLQRAPMAAGQMLLALDRHLGPGDFFGTRQAGLPTLRVGDLLRDHRVMEEARRAAVDWFAREDSRGPLAAYLSDHWAERFGLVGVG